LALGAKDFVGKPFDSAEVLLRIRNLLETHFLYQKLRGQNSELERKVAERTQELEQSQLEVLERLAAAVEFRDDDTGNHTKRIARSPHEWWDGSGYPDRVSGQSIPLEARIVAAADFLDALTHERPYRPAWGIDDTLAEIRRRAGSHFDPGVANALLEIDWRGR